MTKIINREAHIALYQDRKTKLTVADRYCQVFEFRYGLSDGKMHTLAETGKEFGISLGRVGQIIAKTLVRCEEALDIVF